VALLEMAALLARTGPLRSIRLVSFGAEEQLSVGSAQYVDRHRRELASLGVVLNLDSVASVLGHHWMVRAGSNRFGAWLREHLSRWGLDVSEKTDPMPFADHFPFSVFGVPAVTFYRPNMDSGVRWQHHSAHDNLANTSLQELVRVVRAVTGVTRTLAGQDRWPFSRGLAPAQRTGTKRLARDLFDLTITGRKRSTRA
jgi:Zn-dependent M28 family amino/carboxypeptidase